MKRRKYPTRVVKDLDIAASSVTKWKNGTIPSGTTLSKISQYFGVSVDYLLGRELEKTPASAKDDSVDNLIS